MIFRIYPIKDTVISNDYAAFTKVRLTGANLGASEELTVFKRAGMSGNFGDLSASSLARSLLQFDFAQFNSLTGSGEIPSSGVRFFLRMNHKTACGPQPSSFDVSIAPVSSSWDEGFGKDISLKDPGFCNWVKRTSSEYWTARGGDFLSSPRCAFHFDSGFEDLEADVSSIVNSWLSGTIPNNGLAVMLTSSIESDSLYVDYSRKRFYSRHTDFEDRVPYLEARSDDHSPDDRVNMKWSRTGSLFLYNIIGGVYYDLPASNIYTTISDASGVLLHLTASRVQLGLYSASFALPSGTYSGSLFYDSWGSGSYAFMTGTFSFSTASPAKGVSQAPLTARIRNLQDEYFPEDVPIFEVLFRRRPQTLTVVQTASLSVGNPYIVEQAWYGVVNDSTQERVIGFGTGSDHTRLSYGENGNSFKLFMRNLHRGNVYRLIFLVNDQGRQQVIDNGIRFKVV